ncbi:MAG TPA: SCO family protein, partial [Steroidobacteraceae bacterium]
AGGAGSRQEVAAMKARIQATRVGAFTCAGALVLAVAAAATVSRSTVSYKAPEVTLVREDGKSVSLPRELDDGRPVLLNFMFTTCSSTCPLTTRTLEEFQRKLGREAARVHMMSISIDPEQDTPARLNEYAHKFHAGPEWQYYTGTVAASIAAQKAFDVYRGEKMSHTAVTLLRSAPGEPWLRIEGFVTPDELVDDYQKLLASP